MYSNPQPLVDQAALDKSLEHFYELLERYGWMNVVVLMQETQLQYMRLHTETSETRSVTSIAGPGAPSPQSVVPTLESPPSKCQATPSTQ
jgi:hypothetical protein